MGEEELPPYENDEQALSILLKMSGLIYLVDVKNSEGEVIAGVVVNANDVFWWACADNEPLPVDEIHNFYNMVRDESFGNIRWLCMRRKMRPQHPWEKILKEANVWDEKLEAFEVRDFTG